MEKECAMGNGANNSDRGGFAKSFSKFDYTRRRINLDRPFHANRGGAGGSGPTGSNSGGANEAQLLGDHLSMQRRDEYIASSSSSPFHIFNSTEMVAFTSAQWRELERQAMIYKYMISSMPVPSHLLYTPSPMNISLYNTKNGVAVEPGRCKRTDGKKWRCSRDVAPHQKYCERHLHRGRPRSRKPVELNLNINNNNNNNNNKINVDDEKQKKPRLQQTKHFPGSNSDLGSMMPESEMVPANEAGQKWLESNMGFASSVCCSSNSPVLYHHHHEDSNNPVLTYSDFPASIGFIDAWSECNESFSPSLSLSIGGGSGFAGEMGNAQACDGGVGFYGEDSGSPVCWGAFGGPLAEALCANPLVSSPSGVIQRALFSNSGGSSVCNSPSEIGFQRIN